MIRGVLDADNRLQQALETAYRYLNPRDRTISEMRRHLESKGVAADSVESAIQTLTDQGYLNDVQFARAFAEDKRELEQWGDDRIQRGLLERGIDRELAEQTLGADDSEPEIERALGVLRRRFPTPPRDRRERERALGVLLRKGYESELALDALAVYARGE
jgi:regulatory protein